MTHLTLTDETSKKCTSWIFSCISSRFSVLPFCLARLYYYSFFFSSLHFWWQLSCCQWQYYSQLICVIPLSTCNYAQSWWVCFGAVIALFLFTFFVFLPCCIVPFLIFSNFALRWQLSCRQGQYYSQLICLIPLSTCNHAQSWSVSFGAAKELQRFFLLSFHFCVGGFLNFFMINLQCWWIKNLHRTTSLVETHRLTFHSASLLLTTFFFPLSNVSSWRKSGRGARKYWRQRQTDTYVHSDTGNERKKSKYKNCSSPCSMQNVLKSATVHNEGSLTHVTDVDQPVKH